MRTPIKENISLKGSLAGAAALFAMFHLFPGAFGETPVNLFGLGSVNGYKNYFINILSYSLINVVIFGIISLFVKERVKCILSFAFGTCLMAVMLTVFIFFYFEIFWR
ncbi:MAG: hypothetical protein N2489_00780 [Clostridia bacterium]|nr:hypothetical protein [Clostridia bacterium]